MEDGGGGKQDLPFVYVLRRLPPNYLKGNEVRPGAFLLHDGETGLSVYAPDRVTPRRLLQDYINTRYTERRSDDGTVRDKAEGRLQKYGTTAEEMVTIQA